MFKNKKSQGLSITTIIVATIALIVLVVIIAMLTGKLGSFSVGASGVSWSWYEYIYGEETIPITQSHLTLKYLAQKEKISLGELFSKLSEDSNVINTDYLLYGDPTLKLNTKGVVLE